MDEQAIKVVAIEGAAGPLAAYPYASAVAYVVIHTSTVEVGADLVDAIGVGLRIVEIGLIALIGLIVSPPLLILAVVVAANVAIFARVAAVVG